MRCFMKKNRSILKFLGIGVILFLTLALISSEVWARAGGGRSGGFRGSRSFSAHRTQSPGTSQFQGSTPPLRLCRNSIFCHFDRREKSWCLMI